MSEEKEQELSVRNNTPRKENVSAYIEIVEILL